MFSASRLLVAAVMAIVAGAVSPSASPASLRVCADPNNLPFSNQRLQGFENKIAALLAQDVNKPVTYVWWPQRRGFLRNTLYASRCDVVIGVAANDRSVLTTHAYYRSSFTFVSRRDRDLRIRTFDDPRLRTLTIGIQVVGDDYGNPPAAQALAVRHLVQNVHGYSVYGDYSAVVPQRAVVDAVADGAVDVAVVWGPLAGYVARDLRVPLDVIPVTSGPDDRGLTFAFDIAMGVRRGDLVLRGTLDTILERRRLDIRRILTAYGVPLV
jgi:mxaJ protein